MAMTRRLLIASLLSGAAGFKFMSNFKMPTIQGQLREKKAEAKFGTKKLVVITGTSSGLGRKTARALLRTGKYHVVGAVRDLDKMELVAEMDEFNMGDFTAMHCELNSFDSVRKFCAELDKFKLTKPIDRLICNAGIYQPSLPYAKWSEDGHEQTMQVNYFSHFLMISLLMPDMVRAPDPRVILVGSVTGNDNTVGGGGVYPIADLKELEGLKAGAKNPVSMFDGYNFIGAKAYKDSKLCLMMLSNLLHDKYHKQTGIAFSSIYPGCIAESPLFREKRDWFRKYFPLFMKFITGGFVGEEEAGQRLFQVAHGPRCAKSGVYWSWNGGPREGRGTEALEKGGQISGGGGAGGGWDSIFENDQSSKVLNLETATKLFDTSTAITDAEWPTLKQITSPCPTLKVIGAVTQGSVKREELKRVKEGFATAIEVVEEEEVGIASTPATAVPVATAMVQDTPSVTTTKKVVTQKKKNTMSKRQRVVFAVDRTVSFVVGNTVGRVARLIGGKLLGKIPEEAKTGSYHPVMEVDNDEKGTAIADAVLSSSSPVVHQEEEVAATADDEEGIKLIEEVIAVQIKEDRNRLEEQEDIPIVGATATTTTVDEDKEDEELFKNLYDEDTEKVLSN